MKRERMSRKSTFQAIISILMVFIVTSYAFGDTCGNRDVLSPRLNLNEKLFQYHVAVSHQGLFERLTQQVQEDENPYAVLGVVILHISMNDEQLLIRERVEHNEGKVEVHQALTRLLDDGTEKFLGQCWYRLEGTYAVLEADDSYEMRPAFKMNEEGKGYGTVLFASILESARRYKVSFFSAIIAQTSIYELFLFYENELGILDEMYRILSPDDPSNFDIATVLSNQRGIALRVSSVKLPAQERLVVPRTISALETNLHQSI